MRLFIPFFTLFFLLYAPYDNLQNELLCMLSTRFLDRFSHLLSLWCDVLPVSFQPNLPGPAKCVIAERSLRQSDAAFGSD